ncbi:MAG: hypothetical protein KAS32_12730 [Candidatus Peribacteraceae bacterium]|nr:hypothetical protein [Candidatus Peribacteraceae bacterium]
MSALERRALVDALQKAREYIQQSQKCYCSANMKEHGQRCERCKIITHLLEVISEAQELR